MNDDKRPGTCNNTGFPIGFLAALALCIAPALPTEGAERLDAPSGARAQEVERLQSILQAYYSDSAPQLPTTSPQVKSEPDTDPVDKAARVTKAGYSADSVYLTGGEGNALLAHYTRRLKDPRIPELHRDVAPICTVKTRLFDTLVDSKRISLKPVGKHHYIASIKLQPGESTFAIKSQEWQVDVPEDSAAREHLIAFYRDPGRKPQLHTFAIEDMLASTDPLVPGWLPPDIAAKFEP